jgi:hypothetical protein
MSTGLIVTLCFLAAAVLCILTAIVAMFTAKYDADGHITQWNSPLGKVTSKSLPFLTLLIGLVFGGFAFWLQPPAEVDTVMFDGSVYVDKELLADVHSVVVGVTTPPWSHTSTPDNSTGEIKVRIAVPENWKSYIGYAFAHGTAQTRPSVIGLTKESPNFEVRLVKDDP